MGVEELLQVLGTVSWHGLVAYLVSANLVSPHRWERFTATTVADASAPLYRHVSLLGNASCSVMLSHVREGPMPGVIPHLTAITIDAEHGGHLAIGQDVQSVVAEEGVGLFISQPELTPQFHFTPPRTSCPILPRCPPSDKRYLARFHPPHSAGMRRGSLPDVRRQRTPLVQGGLVYGCTSAVMRTSTHGSVGSLVANHTSRTTSPLVSWKSGSKVTVRSAR